MHFTPEWNGAPPPDEPIAIVSTKGWNLELGANEGVRAEEREPV